MKSKMNYTMIAMITLNMAIIPGFITGTVTDASNTPQPIQGAIVIAGGVTATTDAKGFYNVTIGEGTYTMSAGASGFIMNDTTVTVISGSTTTLNFALAPAVVKGDVNPIPGIDVGDVLFCAQFVAGIRTPTAAQITAAEVNPIPGIDVGDVLFIAQAVAGLRAL
jgi:hypothetical protein